MEAGSPLWICCPAGWVPGIRCGWKQVCVSTGMQIDESTTVWEAKLGWICKP